jgi:hypothetical protein
LKQREQNIYNREKCPSPFKEKQYSSNEGRGKYIQETGP